MNPNAEALVRIAIAALIMFLISVVVYFVGCEMAGGILAAAQGEGVTDIPKLVDWKDEHYYYLVQDTGLLAGLILILWTALTHWAPRTGKRAFWALLWIILIALCVALPFIINKFDPQMLFDLRIPLLFVACYGLVGYWGGSIIVSSDTCKFVPPLAVFVRR